jgi:hypothetical protein
MPGNKWHWSYHSKHMDIKHEIFPSIHGQQLTAGSSFVCVTCGFIGMDSYNLSTHLHDYNYCSNKRNNNIAPALASRFDHTTIFGDDSSSRDDDSHPGEGNLFMYANKSDDATVSVNNSVTKKLAGKPKSRSSSSCSESSFASDDYGVASLSSTICQSIVLDFADSTSEEHDSDASSLNGLTLAWLIFIAR